MLTLTQAAKEIGLSRSGVFKAIKAGRVSATKDANGHFQIDPAELFRVYPSVNQINVSGGQQNTAQGTAPERVLQAQLESMGALLRQVQGERDDLRRRLDEEAGERRRLSTLLTYMPPASENAAKGGERGARRVASWVWGVLLSVLVFVAVLGLLVLDSFPIASR